MEAGTVPNESQTAQQQTPIQVERPVQIHIEDPAIIALRQEEEEDDPDADLDDGESEKDDDIEEIDFASLRQDLDENPFLVSPTDDLLQPHEVDFALPTWETKSGAKGVQEPPQRMRKRSHDEMPDDIFTLVGAQKKPDGAVTPPKRQRTDGSYTPSSSPSKDSLLPSPMRARKRSSEELDDEQISADAQNGKRVKATHVTGVN